MELHSLLRTLLCFLATLNSHVFSAELENCVNLFSLTCFKNKNVFVLNLVPLYITHIQVDLFPEKLHLSCLDVPTRNTKFGYIKTSSSLFQNINI
jgi:hypothetical protein